MHRTRKTLPYSGLNSLGLVQCPSHSQPWESKREKKQSRGPAAFASVVVALRKQNRSDPGISSSECRAGRAGGTSPVSAAPSLGHTHTH